MSQNHKTWMPNSCFSNDRWVIGLGSVGYLAFGWGIVNLNLNDGAHPEFNLGLIVLGICVIGLATWLHRKSTKL